MSDGLTDKRGQNEFATEYLRPETVNVLSSQLRERLLSRMLDLPSSAIGDMRVHDLNSFLDCMETELGDIIIAQVEIYHS